ncbi:hypothetical protein [Paracraurococcus lichenis]|uniref:Uncharacterized protein n=1 Tax=Paracraurococcus lichenis TaxID=3064888 RepID=A0ABT9E8B1_9PROT|nr:hypothetical protein [Paracraurococcus sp. LOR1-02]MDO9712442.1 hypothetical protein [Paracraurococcus sp. LOR1-02]
MPADPTDHRPIPPGPGLEAAIASLGVSKDELREGAEAIAGLGRHALTSAQRIADEAPVSAEIFWSLGTRQLRIAALLRILADAVPDA